MIECGKGSNRLGGAQGSYGSGIRILFHMENLQEGEGLRRRGEEEGGGRKSTFIDVGSYARRIMAAFRSRSSSNWDTVLLREVNSTWRDDFCS